MWPESDFRSPERFCDLRQSTPADPPASAGMPAPTNDQPANPPPASGQVGDGAETTMGPGGYPSRNVTLLANSPFSALRGWVSAFLVLLAQVLVRCIPLHTSLEECRLDVGRNPSCLSQHTTPEIHPPFSFHSR